MEELVRLRVLPTWLRWYPKGTGGNIGQLQIPREGLEVLNTLGRMPVGFTELGTR